jgi:DNA-binding NarL/FixJ family response regulator
VIRVVIADDQALVRAGFRMILQTQPDIEVVGEADDGEGALALVRELRPDVVLMDVRMPGIDGLEATRLLVADRLESRVLILTTFDLTEYVYDAMRAGASGFLLKTVPPEQLAAGVRTVAAGDALLAPSITRRLIEQFVRRPVPTSGVPEPLRALTPREVDVLREVAAGSSNAEVGERLFLSEATIKTHMTRILTKLALRDRVQAVVLAYECGLVEPGALGPSAVPRLS